MMSGKSWSYVVQFFCFLVFLAMFPSLIKMDGRKTMSVSSDSVRSQSISDEVRPVVALTFDDGPNASSTPILLDGLKERKVRATFFLIGENVEKGENEKIVKRMYEEGHLIGNHTYTHCNLSKLETGNMLLDLKSIEISGFIKGYVKRKQEIFINEQLEIAVDTNGITGNVAVDPKQLTRVFDNLLENSRKYVETKPLKIKITLKEIKEAFQVCFLDNGMGVSKEKLPYIFDEFYRADESRNKKLGNGLGLYIVKYLIEAMGGSVRAENTDGFSVCIMLKKE